MASSDQSVNKLRLLYLLFNDLGTLIKNIGNEEIKTNQGDFFKNFSTNTIGLLNDFSNNLTTEELGQLMKLFISLANNTTNLTNFLELTPERKLEVGESIMSLAKETNKLIDSIQKRKSI